MPPALIPYDASAKKALELTFQETLRLGHDYIGTEYLLLALPEMEVAAHPATDPRRSPARATAWSRYAGEDR